MKCPKCGNEISPSDKFCTYCGEKIESVRYCQNCGEPLEGRFCTNCGTDSQQSNSRAEPQPTVVYQAPPPVVTVVQAPPPAPAPSRHQLRCPRCGGTQIQAIDSAPAGTKTSLNLNPFHPFTLTKTKKETKRVSKAKLGAAILTFGTSTILTGGIKSKVGVQVFCSQCGHTWEVKK